MMRWFTLVALLALAPLLHAQEKVPPRFGVEADLQKYPQANPKDALRSVLKAIEAKRIDYLLAHLAEPEFVDQRVKDAGDRFPVMVEETTEKLDKNPESIREMRRFLSEGEWPETTGDSIEVKCKEVRGKQLFLKKVGTRWFLDNRIRADKDKEAMATPIDLRSDTVTKPSPGMRAAMQSAEIGDDVYGEDPTVNSLEERVAALLGKEAALFVPSGSMSNQLAVKTHTVPGDELICEEYCHIYNWEAGSPAIISGVTCRTVRAEHGILQPEQLVDKIRPINDHMVRTKLVCLENTHNHGGGRIFPLETIQAIERWARRNNLLMHLDGARLWNAAVATGVPLATWAKCFDTVSVCFSKGLGAPVGSALVGPKAFITAARRFRKVFGGGMRQAGVLAAAVHYALDHNIERLAEDHANAQILAAAVRDCPGLSLPAPDVHTNILWIDVHPELGTARDVGGKLKERGILVSIDHPKRIRCCTHLDASRANVERAAEELRRVGRAG